ncbi:uncharacterized protein LOC134288201 [Aedes albopictus]|uniref:Secreted protein n=1 Tax=Aedes albopictus TaxID=7160 RepID=A0ABM1Z0C2_AEDAL
MDQMFMVRPTVKPLPMLHQLDDDSPPHELERMSSNESTGSAPSSPTSSVATPVVASTVEVHPVVIRKTPKFPSRARHLAIRRKKVCHHQNGDNNGELQGNDFEDADGSGGPGDICYCDKTGDVDDG